MILLLNLKEEPSVTNKMGDKTVNLQLPEYVVITLVNIYAISFHTKLYYPLGIV